MCITVALSLIGTAEMRMVAWRKLILCCSIASCNSGVWLRNEANCLISMMPEGTKSCGGRVRDRGYRVR